MGRKKHFTNRKKQTKIWRAKQKGSKSLTVSIKLEKLPNSIKTHFNCPTVLNSLKQIHESALPLGWTLVSTGDEKLVLCYVCQSSDNKPNISYTLKILNNLTYTVSAFNHHNIHLPDTLPIYDVNSVIHLLEYITQLNVCPGNSLSQHLQLADLTGGTIFNRQG